MPEETKPLELEPIKPDLFWACEYPACACECGHIAGKCEYCHWVGAVFCRCPFVCESTGRLRAGDICPVHGPKPVEREAFEQWAKKHRLVGQLIGLERQGDGYLAEAVSDAWEVWHPAWQASADAALERASALMREMNHPAFAEAILTLKGSH